MDHTTLKLARFYPIFMYNMNAFEHKCKRCSRRGLIAKMPHSGNLLTPKQKMDSTMTFLGKSYPKYI